ncbi:MAG: PilZ domain-containing protein [Anaeromyxobacter sp.]|nr:PilZ domain-containing protein [Anaeromyxobacter sp.]MBL0275251.1 PilZ domain-containing protein [Anaeromyxobacter sp.]
MSEPHDQTCSAIVNPRRAPRLAVRCLVRAAALDRPWTTETEDISQHGCQLLAPLALPRGQEVRLVLTYPSLPEALHVAGAVAWAGPHAPWRHGVAFDAASLPAAERWILRLLAIHPELSCAPRLPARLDPSARLHLGEPPRHIVDFTHEELAVLHLVRAGATAGELRERLGAHWSTSLRALFSLLNRRAVTFDRTEGPAPDAWDAALGPNGPLRPPGEPQRLARLNARPAPTPAGN